MKELQYHSYRPTTMAPNEMITTPHYLASQAGMHVLQAGGNAIEAAIAAASTIGVVYPHMNGIGGDNFWLIFDAKRKQLNFAKFLVQRGINLASKINLSKSMNLEKQLDPKGDTIWLGVVDKEGNAVSLIQSIYHEFDSGFIPKNTGGVLQRWLYGRTWGASSNSLKLESRIPANVIQELRKKGHDVEVLEDFTDVMGHAGVIKIDPSTGVKYGGADPRGDGVAVGH